MALELKAKARSGVGKGAARALRREGWIPAVIYGDKKDPTPISISYNEAMKNIYAGGFLSHVITLDVDGSKQRVIPRDYQLDPVKDFADARGFPPRRRQHQAERPGGGALHQS